ncbi:MAG: S41 family peptidase [Holosporales bacterium]|jgi:carboxyl-terminal processing protease|nr:S41 family peptidase [Holosporales bacterium]
MKIFAHITSAFFLGIGCFSTLQAKLPISEEIKKSVPEEAQPYCLFNVILKHIKEHYVHPIDDETLIEHALEGMLGALDPHSCYLSKKALDAMRIYAEGTYGGLGIEIVMDNGLIRIIAPIDDTPAYHAGLKSGDLITHIDGVFIQGVSAEEVIAQLRGKPGTKVRLKIKRFGKDLFDVTIDRAVIRVRPVRSEFHEDIGYVRISIFDKNTTSELKVAIEKLKKEKGLKGIVLDLRNNPGGLLKEAIGVADLFLDGGEIVSVRGRNPSLNETFSAKKGDILCGIPFVVLVNSGTSSAPEIVAGALQDHHRAIIVGMRTFGKGSVQKVIPISEDGGIKLTVARHHTPSGRCIQAQGIEPDVNVPSAEVKVFNDFVLREKDIPNALDASATNKPEEKSEKETLEIIEKTAEKGEQDKNSDKEAFSDVEKKSYAMPFPERVEKDLQLREAFSIVKALATLGGKK